MAGRLLFSRWIAALCAGTLLGCSVLAPVAQAGMIGTPAAVAAASAEQQRQELRAFLGRDQVRDQLVAWGVEPTEAQARVEHMTPDEVARMHAEMGALPAGGDILGVAVFLFLVLLITDILGFTDIFPFVKKPNQR